MEIVSVISIGVGVACWLSAVVHWLALFGHRAPGVSAGRLIFSGISAFSSANFRPSGHPIQRRMILSFLGFFLFAIGGAVLGAAFGTRAKPAPVVLTSAAPSAAGGSPSSPGGLRSSGASGDGPAAEPDEDGDDACMTAALSMDRAKPRKSAEPPFADCAAGVFSHCGGGDGERGRLCSRPLDLAATREARAKAADACCY